MSLTGEIENSAAEVAQISGRWYIRRLVHGVVDGCFWTYWNGSWSLPSFGAMYAKHFPSEGAARAEIFRLMAEQDWDFYNHRGY
jgi:hypothetical protein